VRAIDAFVRVSGELVAYWALLAVFAYYFEVIGRYVFNSPTNWVHESTFLMFGMQYMIAGAYAYRGESHVRVDLLYTHLPVRAKAMCDVVGSVFVFLFVAVMIWTGWTFASQAVAMGEVSFTEWGIQYWPVKLMIPIGAILLLLQALARLIRDIHLLASPERPTAAFA
jgi:TRAP-type mannitol/chloroaromatic compound transport system permease small subunit